MYASIVMRLPFFHDIAPSDLLNSPLRTALSSERSTWLASTPIVAPPELETGVESTSWALSMEPMTSVAEVFSLPSRKNLSPERSRPA